MGTKISELIQRTPDGQEYFEVIIPPFTPGTNRKVLLSDLSAIIGGAVDSVNGQTGVVQVNADDVPFTPAGNLSATDVQALGLELGAMFRNTRTVTGADPIVQTDDNSLIIFNSASPFNFTLDQITANSKASFINIGAGAVTFTAGSGVTITGSVVLPGATGTSYPTAFVFYHTSTTPRSVISGVSDLDNNEVDTSANFALDFGSEKERLFEGSVAITTPKTVSFSTDTNAILFLLVIEITNVAGVITFPATCVGPSSDSRFASNVFTVPTGATGFYKFTGAKNRAGTVWRLEATNQFAS